MAIRTLNHTVSQLTTQTVSPNFFGEVGFGQGLADLQSQFLLETNQKVVRVKTDAFLEVVRKFQSDRGGLSSIEAVLKKIARLPTGRQDLAKEVSKACFKQSGYITRLFSGESWSEWTDRRTALGKVFDAFQEHLDTRTNVGVLVKRLDGRVVKQAEREADVLLKRLEGLVAVREEGTNVKLDNRAWVDLTSVSSCKAGLAMGVVGSVVTQDPIPFLMGLGGCLPVVEAQIPIGGNFQVSTFPTSSAPSITTLSNGNFFVAWQNGSSPSILGQMYNATGSAIGNNFQVSPFALYTFGNPAITALSNGNFVYAWAGIPSDNVFGQMYNLTGSAIGSGFRVSNFQGDSSPTITALNNGTFIVAWSGCPSSICSESSDIVLLGQIYNATGSAVGSNFQISTFPSYGIPAIAALNNGTFIVAWYGCTSSICSESSDYGILGQMYNAMGSAVGSSFQASTSWAGNPPATTTLSNGNFVISWEGCNPTSCSANGYVILGQIYNAMGSPIGSNFQISTFGSYYPIGSNSQLIVSGSYSFTAITALNNGDFVAAWPDYYSGNLLGQMCNATGSAIGSNFQINTFQIYGGFPAITALSNGNFVISWEGCNPSCSTRTIVAQIYSSNVSSLVVASTGESTSSSSSTGVSSTGFTILSSSSGGSSILSSSLTILPSSTVSSSSGTFSSTTSLTQTASTISSSASTDSNTGFGSSLSVSAEGSSTADSTVLESTFSSSSSSGLPSSSGAASSMGISSTNSSSTGVATSSNGVSSSLSGTASSSAESTNQPSSSGITTSSTGPVSSASVLGGTSSSPVGSASSNTGVSSTNLVTGSSSAPPSSTSSSSEPSNTGLSSTNPSSTSINSSAVPLSTGSTAPSLATMTSSSSTAASNNTNIITASNTATCEIGVQTGSPDSVTGIVGPIGGIFNVSTIPASNGPSITRLCNGNFVVAWCSDSTQPEMFGQIFNATGSTIGEDFIIINNTKFGHSPPAITGLNNGNFVVAWLDYSSHTYSVAESYGQTEIYGQMFNATGSMIGENFQVNAFPVWGGPAITALSNGNFVIAWDSGTSNSFQWDFLGQMYNVMGSPIGESFQISEAYANELLAIAGLSNGNFVIAWRSTQITSFVGQVYNTTGSAIGSNFQIPGDNPAITALRNGNFVCAWIGITTTTGRSSVFFSTVYTVMHQIFNATGSAIGDNVQFVTQQVFDERIVVTPTIIALSNGNFVIAWSGFGQMYNATGSAIGSNFQIPGDNPAITVLSNDNFAIVWSDSTNILGQIYSSNMSSLGVASTGVPSSSSSSTGGGSSNTIVSSTNLVSSTVSRTGTLLTRGATTSSGVTGGNLPNTSSSGDANNSINIASASRAASSTGISSTSSSSTNTSSSSISSTTGSTVPSLHTTTPTTSPATIGAIVGSIAGVSALALICSKIFISWLNARNMRRALARLTQGRNTQSHFYHRAVQPITYRIYAKINSTNALGYRSEKDAEGYLHAVARLTERIEQSVSKLNISDIAPDKQTQIFNIIAEEVRSATATSGCLCLRPRVTPLQIQDKISPIASTIRTKFPDHLLPTMEFAIRV